MDRSSTHRRAFTIVELMIVLLIIAIMAAIVIPRFSGAAEMASSSALAQDLHYLRVQVQVYTAQHNGVSPGYPGGDPTSMPTETTFVAQMTNPTSLYGDVGSTPSQVYRFGPYLAEVPANPVNKSRAIRVLSNTEPMPTSPPASDTGYGWIYKPSDRTVRAFVPGQDENGRFYYEY